MNLLINTQHTTKKMLELTKRELQLSKGEINIFLNSVNRIAAAFPYNEHYINQLKTINGYRWHPDEKQWSVPFTIENAQRIIKIFDVEKLSIDYKLKNRLYQSNEKTAEKLPQLHQVVINDLTELCRTMRLKNYSYKTIKAYLSCIRTFAKSFHPRTPKQLGEKEIREYLIGMSESGKYTAGTINQVFNALRFLYVEFYQKPFVIGKIPRPKKEQKLPDVLNEEEVLRIFKAVENIKHRVILMMTYASGLRVSEVVNLRIEDIDANRMLIHIREAKGKKDRYVPLSEVIVKPLNLYWQAYNLGEKGWLFPGSKTNYHIAVRSIQAVFERAVRKTGITKHASMHTLRHSYATHSHEYGYDIRHIQKLLGHKSLKTTQIYTHISTNEISKIKSPLDFLLKDYILDNKSEGKKLIQ